MIGYLWTRACSVLRTLRRSSLLPGLAAAGAALGCAYHARPARAPADAPRLVVHITVDQLAEPYLERYGAEFTGGLGLLLRQGALFTDAHQDHAMTETAPGHSTVLSGRYPYSTGIVRNAEGVPDPDHGLLEVRGTGASAFRFRGTALFDWLRARDPGARMLSVSRKDRGAILPIGAAHDSAEAYWYAGGQFTTSTWYRDTLPAWVRAFNLAAAPARRPGLAWDLLLPPARYPEPDASPFEADGRHTTFPHLLPDNPVDAAARVIGMPWMDSLTLELALAGLRVERLGRGPATDVLAIGLSTLDQIGHTYGPDSREVHDHLLRLDRYLGAFFTALFHDVDAARVVVSLTADHGVTDKPAVARARGVAAWDVPVDQEIRATRTALEARLGPGRWVPGRDAGMVSLDRAALAARGVDVDSVAEHLARRLRQLPGVASVHTRVTLAAADTLTDHAALRWRRMFAPGTVADVMITPAEGSYLGAGGRIDFEHGSAGDDDAHVPIILMAAGVRPGRYARRVAVVDLAPTLALLCGVRPVGAIDGRVLREALR